MKTQQPTSITVNVVQQLFVIPSGGGYTCLGFDNATEKINKVAQWLHIQPIGYIPGTLEHYQVYTDIMRQGSEYAKKTGQKCLADLTPELIGLENKRVEVTYKDGEKSRFWVSRSTGWMPIHLEIKTTRSMGGAPVFSKDILTISVIRSR